MNFMNFIDTQGRFPYTFSTKKEVLIKAIERNALGAT